MNYGERISILRKQHNMTSSDLAKLLNVSQPVISNIETGKRSLDIHTLEEICSIFSITLADFLNVQNPANNSSNIDLLIREYSDDKLSSLENFLTQLNNINDISNDDFSRLIHSIITILHSTNSSKSIDQLSKIIDFYYNVL